MEAKKPTTSIEQFCDKLRTIFDGPAANIHLIRFAMESYQSYSTNDWEQFAKFDPFTSYTRNLVDKGNGKYNLMILCWNKGQKSKIHDHSNSHCFMKILRGQLNEIQYHNPLRSSENVQKANDSQLLREKSRKILNINDVAYINDSIGLHCIENASEHETAISLHLYCPPFDSCRIFNRTNGEIRICPMVFDAIFDETEQRQNRKDELKENNDDDPNDGNGDEEKNRLKHKSKLNYGQRIAGNVLVTVKATATSNT